MERDRTEYLVQELHEMRAAIAKFHAEQHRYPSSLRELVELHYLRDVPKDPITNAMDWRVTTEETVRNDDFTSTVTNPGNTTVVLDVHSAAGRPYSDY